MRILTKSKRRGFWIESLESRSMLAYGGISSGETLADPDAAGHGPTLGTVDVQVADTVMTYEVFAARGFQSVAGSGSRPTFNGNAHGNPVGVQPIDPAAYRFTFVALPSLQTRLAMINAATPGTHERLQFEWSDALWSSPVTIESPGSKPLALHVESSDDAASDSLMDGSALTDASDADALSEISEPTDAQEIALVAIQGPQASLAASKQALVGRTNRVILELANDRHRDPIDSSPSTQWRGALNDEDANSSITRHDGHPVDALYAILGAGGELFDDAELRSASEHDAITSDRDRQWHWGHDHQYSFLDNWIVDHALSGQRLAGSARLDMVDLPLSMHDAIFGDDGFLGSGWSMTQLFVSAESDAAPTVTDVDSSQIAMAFESLATDNRFASAASVIAVASCYAIHRRSDQQAAYRRSRQNIA